MVNAMKPATVKGFMGLGNVFAVYCAGSVLYDFPYEKGRKKSFQMGITDHWNSCFQRGK